MVEHGLGKGPITFAKIGKICGVDQETAARKLRARFGADVDPAKLTLESAIDTVGTLASDKMELAKAKLRREKAKAAQDEIKAEVMRGNLVPLEVTSRMIVRMISEAKSRILGAVPTGCARGGALAGIAPEQVAKVEEAVMTEIHAALTVLAEGRWNGKA